MPSLERCSAGYVCLDGTGTSPIVARDPWARARNAVLTVLTAANRIHRLFVPTSSADGRGQPDHSWAVRAYDPTIRVGTCWTEQGSQANQLGLA